MSMNHEPSTVSNATATFEYQSSITWGDIRLLHVDQAVNDNLHFSLNIVPLERALSPDFHYYALSYTWGTEHPTEEIYVDGKAFKVTPSLLAALRAIYRRLERENDQIRYLWIDAICIDQNSKPEKSTQVPLMKHIYTHAAAVIVWLGEHADGSESVTLTLVFAEKWWRWFEAKNKAGAWFLKRRSIKREVLGYWKTMEAIGDVCESRHNISRDSLNALANLFYDILRPTNTRKDGLDLEQMAVSDARWKERVLPPTHPFWRSYCKFMLRPWFYRVWTYQEIMLARRAWILCGDDQINWDVLRDFRAKLPLMSLVDRDIQGGILGHSRALILSESAMALHTYSKPLHGIEYLRELLFRFEHRDATEKKDHIYGLLGLVNKLVRDRLEVNYDKSDGNVYREAVALCCSSSHDSDAGIWWIQLMENFMDYPRSSVTDLPSWCPDFSSRGRDVVKTIYFHAERVSQRSKAVREVNPVEFSGDLSDFTVRALRMAIVKTSSSVAAHHFHADVIGDANSDPPLQWRFDRLRDHFFSWYWATYRMFEEADMPNNRLVECVWPRGEGHSTNLPSQRPDKELLDILNLCVESQGMNLNTRKEAAERLGLSIDRCKILTGHMAEAVKFNQGRYFFTTDCGGFGHSNRSVAAGDLICYFPGGQHLHVLRKDGHNYKYHSAAHLDGLMGDAIAELPKKKRTLHSFTLK